MKFIIISIYFFFCIPANAKGYHAIAQDRVWQSLNLYSKQQPEVYLRKIIAEFKAPENFIKRNKGSHPQCLHPAKYKYLKRKGILETKDVNCTGLNKWLENIQKKELKVVLASQFISNPASIMGHTFFKLTDKDFPEYSNTAINYAARIPDDTSAISYAYKGLFGGFKGVFSKSPFYEKVQEYSNIERRDLWEFTIDLNEGEIDFLLRRVWELKFGEDLNYLFATKNCSYMLIELIELIRPNSRLTKSFRTYVIPHETIKRLKHFNLISEVKFIPSARKKLIQNFSKLNNKEKEELLKSIDLENTNLNSIQQFELNSKQLDTYLNYYALQRYKNNGKLAPNQEKNKNNVLIKRSKMKTTYNEESTTPLSPLKAHDPYRVSIYHLKENSFSNGFIFNPGFHSFMDYSAGFLENSQFDFFTFDLNHAKRLTLREFTFSHITNLSQYNKIDPTNSWELYIKNINKSRCRFKSCQFSQIYFNLGMSSSFNYLGLGFDFHLKKTRQTYLHPTINHKLYFQNNSFKILLNTLIASKTQIFHDLKVRKYRIYDHLDMQASILYNGDRNTNYELKIIYDY